MKGRKHSWWGKSVKILIALWARSLMTVRVESCRISFGKSLTEHLWKKRVKISQGRAWRFHFRLSESEIVGKPPKTLHHWYRDIWTFSRKDNISRKSFSSSGKVHFSLFTSGLHLCKKKLFCWRILIYSSTYAISKSMSVSDIQGNYLHLVPACLYQPFFTRRHPRSSTLGKYLWLN